MNKKILLGLFIILIMGFNVNAFEFKIGPTLTVSLEGPEHIKVGEPFWVDVFVTSSKESIGKTNLYFTSSDGLFFTGNATSGNIFQQGLAFNLAFDHTPQSMEVTSANILVSLKTKQRLTSLELVAKKEGEFKIKLYPDNSYSYYDSVKSALLFVPKMVTTAQPVQIKLNLCTAKKDCSEQKDCLNSVCTDNVLVIDSPGKEFVEALFALPGEDQKLMANTLIALYNVPVDKDDSLLDVVNKKLLSMVEVLVDWYKGLKAAAVI